MEYVITAKDLVTDVLKNIQSEARQTKKDVDNVGKKKTNTKLLGLAKQMAVAEKASKQVDKITNSTNQVTKATEKAKGKSIFWGALGGTINKTSNKFGIMGDLTHDLSGSMIQAGGAVGALGVGLGAVAIGGAAAIGIGYGLFKVFSLMESSMAGYNKQLNKVHGSLGEFGGDSEEIINRAMKNNVRYGKSWQEVSDMMATARKSGLSIDQAEQWSRMRIGFDDSSDAGKNFVAVMDKITSPGAGKKFNNTTEDIIAVSNALKYLGLKGAKDQSKKDVLSFIGKSADKQKQILLSVPGAVDQALKSTERAVDPIEKVKLAFGTLMDRVFGMNGEQTPLGALIDKLVAWTEKPETETKIIKFFQDLSKLVSGIDPDNIIALAEGLGKVASVLLSIAKFYSDHPTLAALLFGGPILAGIELAVENRDAIGNALSNTPSTVTQHTLPSGVPGLPTIPTINAPSLNVPTPTTTTTPAWTPSASIDNQYFGDTDNSKKEIHNQYDMSFRIETKATSQEVRSEMTKWAEDWKYQNDNE